jgi:outer membrane protein TolC
MRIKSTLTIIFLILMVLPAQSQKTKVQEVELGLTLNQAVELACKQSIASFRNKNMYLARYWQFRSYKAERLPNLRLSATPFTYNKSYVFDQSSKQYVSDESLRSLGSLSLNQNVALTGGEISIVSSLERYENFMRDDVSFRSVPYSIAFNQPLNGYNEFRWSAKIEPLAFEIAKRELVQSIEEVTLTTNQYFFSTASSEINLQIAQTNYQNSDTLFRIAKGRFEIGTVTQDELLDFELSFLNAKIDLTKANLALRQSRITLNSFLGLDETVVVKCLIPNQIPGFEVNLDKALSLSISNNPDILQQQQSLLIARRNVAEARAKSGLSATVNANFGKNRTAKDMPEAYKKPFNDNRGVGVSLSVPILDWGYRHGRIQMAKSNREVTEAEVKQARIDFEQNIFQQVMEFNLQDDQVLIAAKADTIAQMGFDVTKQRFMIDKVDVLKLNSARNSLDAARRNYIDALRRYWNYYYTLRRLTLYDFENNKPLMDNFDQLVQDL